MRRLSAKAGWLGAIFIVAMLLVALSYQEPRSDGKDAAAPTVPSSVRSPSDPASQVPASSTISPTQPAPSSAPLKSVAPARPSKLAIPAIGLDAQFGSPIVSTHDGEGWSITPPESTLQDLRLVYWWSETKYSALPGSPSKGTTFIYGHACRDPQYGCAFDRLKNLTKGDKIELTAGKAVLTYRVTALLKLDKTPQGVGASRELYSYGESNKLRLVTCGYTAEGTSPFNWAALAVLVSS